jgi:hypothetical protein
VSTIVSVTSGPYLAACALLVVTGIAKVRQPAATATAMRAAAVGLPGREGMARAIGGAEMALGVVAIVVGGSIAPAVAAAYLAFVVVALRLRGAAPGTKCGCIGDRSGSVGFAHVLSGVAAFVAAAVYAAGNGAGVTTVLRDQPLAGAPFVMLVACCVGIVSLFLSSSSEEHTWLH